MFRFEVLSEEPLPDAGLSLTDLYDMTITGDCSGMFLPLEVLNQVLGGKQAAAALQRQGSDPQFFQINADGNDLEPEVCDECGCSIPDLDGGQQANKHHLESCSLFDANND